MSSPKDLERRINENLVAIEKMEDRIRWILRKIEWRRRRVRELGKQRTEELNFKLDLK